ncbi:MAG TPA: glycosyltransferase family 4 protein [Candidatus Acidoferrales bacterium]|nr:glycosyltransferase family 4 protein [Candidatus Acidoferrales bacterium]
MTRIAYYYREWSEYIEIDLRLLSRSHDVVATECPGRWPRPFATWRTIRSADVVMSWFASWHAIVPALIARLLHRPFFVVVGGYDTACLPGIDYGHRRGGFKAWVAESVMALATRVIAISEFTVGEVTAMGVPAERIALIPLGLDPARYHCADVRDRDLVVTTGGVYRSNLTRKGLAVFVRAAAECPELHFALVGPWVDDAIEELRAFAGPNVKFTGWLAHEEKVALLGRAGVVVQASQHEAFGLALAEGMVCGAVPVVTRAGALPWVAGGTGVVVDSQDAVALAGAIRSARALAPAAGQAARARVLAEFSLERRAERLGRLLAGHDVAGPEAPAGGAERAA